MVDRGDAQPGTSDAALYTATQNTAFTKVIAFNTTGGSQTLTLSVVRAASGVTEPICTALPVGASVALSLVQMRLQALDEVLLFNGDAIHGLASAGSAVNVLIF